MGATLDQFDAFDLTDNDIRRLDGFPLLKRLKSLLLSNNRIVRISPTLPECLPNLESVYLTNNLIADLHDVDVFEQLPRLEYLSLIANPVTAKEHYRAYVIHKVPQLRVLDFRRIRQRERDAAKKLFKSKSGKELVKAVNRSKAAAAASANTFTPGEGLPQNKNKAQGLSEEEQQAIREAINQARSMEEVEKLQKMLKAGKIPGSKNGVTTEDENGNEGADDVIEVEDDAMET
ncbi:U2 small nuclear ribonucleoprotein A' [Hyalella azteca]|uniref:Probable U2 small nuclear ribonucleoprotein A' n=1 Tax=Hyalella azteca TaxID=294128 RepID=A0A8B7PKE8_HYAAZ|nr:U2 small nuclear ribonucleoprotein A' [Hyalella azteca]